MTARSAALEDRETGQQLLNSWLSERGFALSGCRIASLTSDDELHGGSERGLVATRDLPRGHVLFRVPLDAVLSPRTTKIASEIANGGLTGWNALVAAITYESADPSSPWKPYLDALPEALDTPLFWSKAELALLEGTRVDVRANLPQIRRETAEASTVMLPMADMLNAKPTGVSANLYALDDGSFEMQTICEVPAGREIFNTYGARPNSELLLRYGYVRSFNPADASAFSLGEIFSALEDEAAEGRGGSGGLAAARARARICYLRRRGSLSAGAEEDDGPPFVPREVVLPVRLARAIPPDGEEYDNPVGGRTASALLWRVAGGPEGARAVRRAAKSRLRALAAGDAACRALTGAQADARGARRIRYARHVRAIERTIFTALEQDATEYATVVESIGRGKCGVLGSASM